MEGGTWCPDSPVPRCPHCQPLPGGSRVQPCVAASRGPSCPPARVPSPFSWQAQPHALCSLSSLWGVLPRILRWKRLNPVPTATPARCPTLPPQMGPTCMMRQDEPPRPAKNAQGSRPGTGDAVGASSARAHGGPASSSHLETLGGPLGGEGWPRPPDAAAGCWDKREVGGGGGWGRGVVQSGPSLAVLLWPQ